MKFTLILLIDIVFCCALANANFVGYKGTDCVLQYLKAKGKFNNNFPTIEPSSTCDFVMSLKMGLMNDTYNREINRKFPQESRCLISELDNESIYDLVLKAVTIKYAPITQVPLKTQWVETKKELRQVLENIALKCKADNNTFIQIFNQSLGIDNESLQLSYCMANYASHENLFDWNVVSNPNHVHTELINCTQLIEEYRIKCEKKLIDFPEESADCVRKAYEKYRFFDWSVAFEVLSDSDISKELKESEAKRISNEREKFLSAASVCTNSETGAAPRAFGTTIIFVALFLVLFC